MNSNVVLIVLFLSSCQRCLTDSYIAGEYLNIKDCSVTYSSNETLVQCLSVNLNVTNLTCLIGFNETMKYGSVTIKKKQLQNLSDSIFVNYTIRQLNLVQNQIVYISNETFRYINDLQVLKLDNNFIGEDSFRAIQFSQMTNENIRQQLQVRVNLIGQLGNILPGSFSNTTILNLKSNKINHLCDRVFENFKNLKFLDLSSNALVELTAQVFANLTSLTYLNLNSNNLKVIESFTFAYTPGLLDLLMNKNKLENLNDNTFGLDNPKLARVQLKFNRFDKLPQAIMKKALSLSQLQLDGNRMSSFDFNSIANMSNLTKLNLGMCKIDRLIYNYNGNSYSLGAISELDLSYSNLNEFDFSFVIDYLTGLKELSLKYNQLKSITYSHMLKLHQKLFSLSLDNNLISELTPNNFQKFSGLTYLYLQQNLIRTLPSQAFKGLVALTNLDLSQNQIVSVASDAFNGLNNLNTLNMSYNRLRIIASSSLSGLLSLNVLDLSWNKLESVKQTDFEPVRSLTNLYLSNNFIISIEPYSFQSLINLKTLCLDWNYLTTVKDFTFSWLLDLDYLSLYSNYIQSIEDFSFDRSRILVLDLGSNYLVSFEFLPNIADFVKVVSLSDNEYTSFKVKTYEQDWYKYDVEKIDLSLNKISEFRFESDQFHSIQSVDLSWNLIESIRIDDFRSLVNLKDLNLSNNRLKYVEEGFFSYFKFRSLILNHSLFENSFSLNTLSLNLTEIDLSFNNLDQKIDEDGDNILNLNGNSLKVLRLENVHFEINETSLNFDKYTQLTTLDLSYNNLTFDLNRLNVLSNLKRLYLKSTGIQSLDGVYFELDTLNELNLAQNGICSVPRDFFRSLNDLYVIDLSYNIIEFIDETLLDTLTQLNELNLEHNRIGGLFMLPFTKFCEKIYLSGNNLGQFRRPEDMDVLNYLKLLDLSNNRLISVDFDLFFNSKSCKLHTLCLNDNLIDTLPAYTFNEMVILRKLYLSGNLLRKLNEETFAYLMTLEWLDLSRNQLILNENFSLFDNLVQLKHLNLSCNQIEYVNQRLFAHLFNLNELDLSLNRLKGIEPYSLSSLGQLTYLDVSNNSDLILKENSLYGIDSIKDVWISFDQLADNTINPQKLLNSFTLTAMRHVTDITYYRSVYINYPETNVDCLLTIRLIRFNLQLKLRSEDDYSLFINKCYYLNFFP